MFYCVSAVNQIPAGLELLLLDRDYGVNALSHHCVPRFEQRKIPTNIENDEPVRRASEHIRKRQVSRVPALIREDLVPEVGEHAAVFPRNREIRGVLIHNVPHVALVPRAGSDEYVADVWIVDAVCQVELPFA